MSSTRFLITALFACATGAALLPAQAAPYDASMAIKAYSQADVARWDKAAQRVTIMRDKWGIPHVFGKTDADAVFGLMYAQAEDDFNRVELNYINAMGRLAEVEGEARDLARPAHEAVHPAGRHEGQVRGQPGMAEEADERPSPMA